MKEKEKKSLPNDSGDKGTQLFKDFDSKGLELIDAPYNSGVKFRVYRLGDTGFEAEYYAQDRQFTKLIDSKTGGEINLRPYCVGDVTPSKTIKNTFFLMSGKRRAGFVSKDEGLKIKGFVSEIDLIADLKTLQSQNDLRGISEAITQYLESKFKIITKSIDPPEIWIYEAGIYVPNGCNTLRTKIRRFLDQEFRIIIENEVIAKITRDTFDSKFLDRQNPDEICIKNGVLNLSSLELSPHTPDKIFIQKIPTSYDPDVTPEVWQGFLDSILPKKEDQVILQEFLGSILLRPYRYQKALFLLGEGSNGKTTLLLILSNIIGSDNVCSLPLNQLLKNNFSASSLFGKLANVCGDTSSNFEADWSVFKKLVGGDKLFCDRKYLVPIEFINEAKLIFNTNVLPKIPFNNDNYAFWRRILIINFEEKFVDSLDGVEGNEHVHLKDVNILSKLIDENTKSAVLNWLLTGLQSLFAKGGFSENRTSTDLRESWILSSNPLQFFFEKYVILDPEAEISKAEFYTTFQNFCKINHVSCVSQKVVSTFLKLNGIGERQLFSSGLRVWVGLRITGITPITPFSQPFNISTEQSNSSKNPVIPVIPVMDQDAFINPFKKVADLCVSGASKSELLKHFSDENIAFFMQKGVIFEQKQGFFVENKGF